MKRDDKIRASFGRIVMLQDTKQRVWARIRAANEKETAEMKRKSRRWVAVAAVAAVVAAVAVVVGLAVARVPGDDAYMAAATPVPDVSQDAKGDQTDGVELPQEGDDVREDEAPAGEYGDTIYLTNLIADSVSLDVPDTLSIYEDVPISITEEEMGAVEENATAHGWQNIDMDGTEHEGLYFIWSRDVKGDILQITDQAHHDMRVQFLMESGLADLLEAKGMTLNLDESDVNGAVWSMDDGRRGSGFVRLGFEQGKIVGDCKIWAVNSQLAANSNTIPLQEAAQKAFFIAPEGVPPDPDAAYIADTAELVYVSGIPIYKFTIPRPGLRCFYIANALAVDESVIAQNENLQAAYERFLECGF